MPKQNFRSPRIRAKTNCASRLDSIDEALNCCRKVRALAELLFRSEAHSLSPKTVAVTGGLIADEIEKLCKRLDGLQPKN